MYEEIYLCVSIIPKGKVSTYGGIAKAIRRPNCSRVVGYALHRNPSPSKIPCHRVVFADGSLSKAFAFGGENKQRELLTKEGVKFLENGKVNMKKFNHTFD